MPRLNLGFASGHRMSVSDAVIMTTSEDFGCIQMGRKDFTMNQHHELIYAHIAWQYRASVAAELVDVSLFRFFDRGHSSSHDVEGAKSLHSVVLCLKVR